MTDLKLFFTSLEDEVNSGLNLTSVIAIFGFVLFIIGVIYYFVTVYKTIVNSERRRRTSRKRNKIHIREKDLEKIIYHCKNEWPIEACGVLAGKKSRVREEAVKEVEKVYVCSNEAKSTSRYRIDAEEQYRVFSEIENLELELLGFYHSHPYSIIDYTPSSIDEEKANYHMCSYMIVSFTIYSSIKVTSWLLNEEGMFEEEEIVKI